MHLGRKLKGFITDKGLTIKAFSEAIGVTEQHVYRMLKAEDLSTEVLRKASNVLDVPLSAFFIEEDSQTQTGLANFSGNASKNKVKQRVKNINQGSEISSIGAISYNIDQITRDLQSCITEKKSLEREVIQLQKKNIALQDELLQQYRARQ